MFAEEFEGVRKWLEKWRGIRGEDDIKGLFIFAWQRWQWFKKDRKEWEEREYI